MISSTYTPANWYWFVGQETSKVFSSAKFAYVPTSDATYVAWAANTKATTIDSTESLIVVLSDQVMPTYFVNGMSLTSNANPDLNGDYTLDPTSTQQITAIATSIAAGRGVPGGGTTFMYQGHQFTSEDFLNFADAASNFVYNSNVALQKIVLTGTGSMPVQPTTIP